MNKLLLITLTLVCLDLWAQPISTHPETPAVNTSVFTFLFSSSHSPTAAIAQLRDDDGNQIGTLAREGNASSNHLSFRVTMLSGLATQLKPNTTYHMYASQPIATKISDGTQWPSTAGVFHSFTTGNDNTRPDIINSSASPTNLSTNVSGKGPFVLVVDEIVTKGTGTIGFVAMDDEGVSQSIVVESSQVTIVNSNSVLPKSTITINLNTFLASHGTANYQLKINPGVFLDESGNVNLTETITYTIEDTYALDSDGPVILAQTPAPNEVQVTATTYTITFDEKPFINGPIFLKDAFDHSVYVSMNYRWKEGDENTLELYTIGGTTPWARTFYVEIAEGTITDWAGNAFAGLAPGDWEFRILDNKAPVIVSTTPADGSVDVATDIGAFSITFDEDVVAGPGNIYIVKENPLSSDVTHQAFAMNSDNVSIDGRVMTIAGINTLGGNTNYYMSAAYGFVEDPYGNKSQSLLSQYAWNFTTESAPGSPPILTSMTPEDNTVDVSPSSNFLLVFNEPIYVGAGNILIKTASDDQVAATIPVGSTEVEVSGSSVTINPTSDLAGNTEYYIEIGTGVFEDNENTAFAGIAANAWSFTTLDQTSSSILSFTPSNGSVLDYTAVTQFQIEYSEPIVKGTGTITVLKMTGGQTLKSYDVASSPDVSISGNVVTLSNFTPAAHGNCRIVTTTSVFKDTDDNVAEVWATSDWQFSLAEFVAPQLTESIPANGVTLTTAPSFLYVNADEGLYKGSGFINVKRVSDDVLLAAFDINGSEVSHTQFSSQVFINSTSPLPEGELMYLEIPEGVLKDQFGNWMTIEKGDVQFETIEKTSPVFTGATPVEGTFDLPSITTFTFTFDEDIVFGASGSLVFRVGASQHHVLTKNSSNVSIVGNQLIVSDVTLWSDSDYTVTSSTTFLQDAAGNYVAPLSYHFSTEDYQGPRISSLSPLNGSNNLTLDQALTVNFNEDVFVGSGDIVVTSLYSPYTSYSIDVASDEVTISGAAVSIRPENGLTNKDYFQLLIPEGAFKDASDNLSASNNAWFLQTGDFQAPDRISSFPTNGQELTRTFFESNYRFIQMGFHEHISLGEGLIVIYKDGNAVLFIDGEGSEISKPINNTIRISIPELEAGSYHVEFFNDGVVTDLAGNPLPAMIGSDQWYFKITKSSQSITFPQPGTMTFGDASFSPGATSNSSLPVAYSIVSGPAVIVDGMVQINGAGSVTVAANQSGNGYFEPASEVSRTFTVNKSNQTISIAPIDDTPRNAEPFDITASTTGDGTLNYAVSGDATISGSTITLDGVVGSVTVTVSQSGTTNYNAASEQITFNVLDVDDVNPTRTSEHPTHEGTFANLDFAANISLNENVQEGSGTIALYKSDGTHIETVTTGVGDARVSINAFRMGFDFDAMLEELTEYYITISAGAIEDLVGNPFDGVVAGDWSFTSNARPQISSLIPNDGGDMVATDATFTLTFDQSMAASENATLLVKNYDTDAVVQTVDLSDGYFEDGVVQFLGNGLPESTHLYIVVGGAEMFYGGGTSEIFVGLDDKEDWDFTTGDETAPQWLSLSPTDEANQVSVNSLWTATFDESIALVEGESQTVVIYKNTTGAPYLLLGSDDIRLHVSGNTLTIDLGIQLDYGTPYWIWLRDITDMSGNYIEGFVKESWNFTTEKGTQTISISPIANKTIEDLPFSVVASSSVGLEIDYAVTGPATISEDGLITLSGAAGTVVVTASNDGNTQYHASSTSISFNVIDESLEDQTITFSVGDQVYGQTVSLNGVASSSLAVSYEIVSGPISLSGNSLILTGVGTAILRALQAGNDLYNPAEPVLVEFSVSKAPLTVTAIDQSAVFGKALPTFIVAYTGFVNGEAESVLSEKPLISSTATASSDAGIYDIELAGGSADNYSIKLVKGTLTIEKAEATVTLSDLTHHEDGGAKSPTVVTDPVELNVVLTYDGADEAPSAAGTYEVVATIDETNYTGSATAALTISENTITGVQPTARSISVFPNPTSDWLAVSGLTDRYAQLSLLDLEGRVVLSQAIEPAQRIHVTDLKAGIYMLQLVQKDITTTTKILIH
ncbi:Ig-like domain-containing protein [Reichenbachiella sp.]